MTGYVTGGAIRALRQRRGVLQLLRRQAAAAGAGSAGRRACAARGTYGRRARSQPAPSHDVRALHLLPRVCHDRPRAGSEALPGAGGGGPLPAPRPRQALCVLQPPRSV